jgi:SAM-dependent methyltransferase
VAAIAPWLTESGPVVEVGVGTGLIARLLAARGYSLVGFDVSLRMLEQAYRRLGPRVAVGDAHRLPARGSVAAAVIYVHVLHLVADIPATLAEAARVLRPRGRVVAVCAARGEPADDADRLLASLRLRLTGPRADVPDRVAEAARSAGLAVVHEQQLRHDVPSAPADYARSLQERLWSWTWDVDSETWDELVAPVITELRTMPHADQARSTSHSRSLVVLAAP